MPAHVMKNRIGEEILFPRYALRLKLTANGMAKRILVRNQGPVKENAIKAIAAAFAEAKTAGAKTIHLIVPAKSAFSGSVVADSLGDNGTKELLKGNTVEIKDGISLLLESPKTLRDSTAATVALAVYLGARDLRIADGLCNLKSIIFLPWISEDGEGWQQSWNAMVLGEKFPENQLDLHPELEQKLKNLTGHINLSTGLSHPCDMEAAKHMFSYLVANSIPFEPSKIRSWVLRNGWRPDFAEDVYELAGRSK